MFTFWRSNIIILWWQRTIRFKRSVICVQDITTLWCCRTTLAFVLLCHCHLVDRIEKNDHSGVKLVSSHTRLLPIMTLHCTIIPCYCIIQLKKGKMADLSPVSEVLTTLNHLPVNRSWDWSTCANGDTLLTGYPWHGENVWSIIAGTGAFSASRNGSDVIQDGGRKRTLRLCL